MSDTPAQPGLDSLSKSFEPAALEAHWGPEWEQRDYGHAGVRGTGQPDANAPSFAIQLPRPTSPARCTWAMRSTKPSWTA